MILRSAHRDFEIALSPLKPLSSSISLSTTSMLPRYTLDGELNSYVDPRKRIGEANILSKASTYFVLMSMASGAGSSRTPYGNPFDNCFLLLLISNCMRFRNIFEAYI